jgi:hypothetical protein
MNQNKLTQNHYLYGNKGAVWTNAVHIAKSGQARTLCGTPMLSNNWARILEIEHAGCPNCIAAYNSANGYGDESPEEYKRMLMEVGIVK